MPYLGGVAVFAGVAVGVCVGRPVALVPLAAALAVGVSDDRFDLPAPVRLAAQLGVGALIAATQPVHLPGWIGVPLVMAASVVVINGFNLLDGLDMLAAGVGAAAAVGFAVVTHGPARLDGGLADRGPGRVPLVQPSSGPHLSGGRRLLPARGVHDRASRLRLGRRRPRCDRRARPGPAGRPGGRGGVRRRATAPQRPLAPEPATAPIPTTSSWPQAGPAPRPVPPTSSSRSAVVVPWWRW